MSAIITDQLRISRASQFVSAASSTTYYSFIGLSNPTDYQDNWDESPPAPRDSFEQENDYWDTMVSLKKIYPSDVKQVIRKITWESGTTYDMYRHDISRTNLARPSGATSLYSSNYYVVNSNYQVYICIHNGTTPNNPNGVPSQIEPTFVDLEPRILDDGYSWKYLFSLSAEEIIKFNSTNFVPVPSNWGEAEPTFSIKNNTTTSGQIKNIVITNRGNYSNIPNIRNTVFNNVPIKGDGTGAIVSITINNNSQVESVFVVNGGSGYTYGRLDLVAGGLPTGTITPTFDVIIPPKGGHGYDIYRELGAFYVALYSRIENDEENPDFITGNQIARIGVVENPEKYTSPSVLTDDKVSAVSALKLVGITNPDDYQNATFTADSIITQIVGTGVTAVARVVSYDQRTGVLKYWQDKTLYGFTVDGLQQNSTYGFDLTEFTSTPTTGGSLSIFGGSITLNIDNNFGTISNPGISTVINNRTYKLGQSFIEGISNPEVKKHSGNIIYVDNRPAITRSQNQKEDIKIIIQF